MTEQHDFWHYHNWVWVIVMCFFPRITILIATTVGGGFWYWVGWLIAPRLLVAILATYYFGHTNTTMVVFAWFWAFMGEGSEKAMCTCSRSKS